jgi:hypothetical protein
MPSVPFDWMVQRPQQIMTKLAGHGYKVYYFDNKSTSGIVQKEPNLNVVGSNYSLSNIEYEGSVVLWCSSPDQVLNVDKIPHDYIVYDVVDDASNEFIGWQPYINKMLERAHIVFTTADRLYEKFKMFHPKVYLLNNAVNLNNFSLSKIEKPKDLPTFRPIVGYMGAVASWIDWDIVDSITKQSRYNFVFIGPFYNGFKPRLIKSNIYYLGIKDYDKLPYYVNNFRCCIIPFKVNDMTNSCNPVKLYEYFSLGKPVVTTNMKEIHKFSELCYIANNAEEFKRYIDRAINEKSSELINKRIITAGQNSWDARINSIKNILYDEFHIS